MTYSKHTWVNGSAPALEATNLNEIEQGIYDAHELNQNLISGVSPTLIGWTVDPTDGADITDGDVSTICTTGNCITTGGWQYAYFEWDIGDFYNVLCTGFGSVAATAGWGHAYVHFYNGSTWDITAWWFVSNSARYGVVASGYGSKIRLGITSDAAATVSPNIREFCAWGLE